MFAIAFGLGQMAGSCECGNEPSRSIKYEEISWLASEDMLASQEGLCYMALDSQLLM